MTDHKGESQPPSNKEKAMGKHVCASYRPGEPFCADGFVVRSLCVGDFACRGCGQVREGAIPPCLWDELPKQWLTDDGRPRFYRTAKPAGEDNG